VTVQPTALPVIPENLPSTLTALPRWVSWRFQPDGAKFRKVPKDCKTGRNARVTDPACWSPFDLAEAKLGLRKRDRPDGLGFVFVAEDGLAGVDLDRCRDPETGVIEPWARTIVRRLDTYTEVSPSGTGVKFVLRGALPPHGRRSGRVEMYDRDRYFALTGHRLEGTPAEVMARQEALQALHADTFPPPDDRPPEETLKGVVFPGAGLTDDEVLDHLRAGPQGEKFSRLLAGKWSGYSSGSEADLALAGMLAREVGPDRERVERLFARSRLALRPKWRDRPDYRADTVGTAVAGLVRFPGSRPPAVRLTMTYQDLPDQTELTQSADGRDGSELTADRLEAAVAAATALAIEQDGQGDDFEASFALARRLLRFGPSPEPFRVAAKAYCREAGRPFDAVWLRVLECWPRVRVVEGDGDWAWAARMAVDQPLDLLPGAGVMANRAASLAYYLSRRKQPFPFGVEKVAEVLGMSAPMGTVVIRLLKSRGLIRLTREYDRRLKQAREYEFVAEVLAQPAPAA
jgi:putative DNA primase/helicase